ncbi:MAG: hypothetical protein N3A66_02930, partial [Planctomycetota bacterium]|nr:hypothetical protein [Planctomycetota bacterium]
RADAYELAAALAAGENESGAKGPGQGKLCNRLERKREARPGARLKNFVEAALPGAREEIARHEAAMQAIKEKAQALGQEIKAAVQAAATPEAKREVGKSYEPKVRAIAAEIVDERLNHEQKMLDLRKANREQAVDMTFKLIVGRALAKKEGLGPGPKPPRENLREKMRERREKREGENAPGANPQTPPSPPPPQQGEGEPPQPAPSGQPPQADAEQAIADELAAALEQALL